MTDRDRLAADLTATDTLRVSEQADRLIALGWTRLDEERLARALATAGFGAADDIAADAIAKAYREDAGRK